MNERRLARLQEQIKERLAMLLQREIADPKLGLVTITRVELDSEFTVCKAYWSVLAPTAIGEQKAKKDSEGVLQRARGLLQREVGRGLHTRTIPRLEFVHDVGIAGAIRINKLLQELNHQDAKPGDQPAGGAPAADQPGAGPGGPGDGNAPPPTSGA